MQAHGCTRADPVPRGRGGDRQQGNGRAPRRGPHRAPLAFVAVRLATLLLALGLGAGFGVLGRAASAEPAAAPPSCFERPEVVSYLERLQNRVMKAWVLPVDDVVLGQQVVMRLRIEGGGMLVGYELLSWRDRRLAQSAQAAVLMSFPFEALHGPTRCLVNETIQTTLQAE